MNTSGLPAWVIEAARLPLAFAQVREDPLLDLHVVQRIGNHVRIIMIASGGCTAAALSASRCVRHIHLVDPNPAQIALTRLKLFLLRTATTKERLELLGHTPLAAMEREKQLGELLSSLDLKLETLGPKETVSQSGPDHAGRYEIVFAALRRAVAKDHGMRSQGLRTILTLREPEQQSRLVAPGTELGRSLDAAYDETLSQSNLVALFGEQATNNRVEPFSRHFARRTRHALATLPAADNPYLWQMLNGSFPDRASYPWFTVEPQPDGPTVTCSCSMMAAALQETPNEFDFVHLSNILDWLSSDEARTTLEHTAKALKPGGWTLIRQLNSTLDIPALGPQFEWYDTEAQKLHAVDRSFFYRALHLGRKR